MPFTTPLFRGSSRLQSATSSPETDDPRIALHLSSSGKRGSGQPWYGQGRRAARGHRPCPKQRILRSDRYRVNHTSDCRSTPARANGTRSTRSSLPCMSSSTALSGRVIPSASITPSRSSRSCSLGSGSRTFSSSRSAAERYGLSHYRRAMRIRSRDMPMHKRGPLAGTAIRHCLGHGCVTSTGSVPSTSAEKN